MRLSNKLTVNSGPMNKNIGEIFQLIAIEENEIIVAQVSQSHAKEVVDEFGRSLAICWRGQHLTRLLNYKVKGFLEERSVSGIFSKFGQCEFYGVQVRTNRVLTVTYHVFTDKFVYVWSKLRPHTPQNCLH